jgi:hypothetical protein
VKFIIDIRNMRCERGRVPYYIILLFLQEDSVSNDETSNGGVSNGGIPGSVGGGASGVVGGTGGKRKRKKKSVKKKNNTKRNSLPNAGGEAGLPSESTAIFQMDIDINSIEHNSVLSPSTIKVVP